MNFPHASINEKIYSMKSNKCAICSEKADKPEKHLHGTILTSCGNSAEKQLQKQIALKRLKTREFSYRLSSSFTTVVAATRESRSHRQGHTIQSQSKHHSSQEQTEQVSNAQRGKAVANNPCCLASV